MPNAADIAWFKEHFGPTVAERTQGTPFDVDMLAALACQETGEVWPILRKTNLSIDRILELCVGDTLDSSSGRVAFPQTKSQLVAWPRGQEMFDLAHTSLVDMAGYVASYRGAARNAAKFCHGFGMFQKDIQFFKPEPDYFLDKRYAVFSETLGHAIAELDAAMGRIGWTGRTRLSDLEKAAVAIAYNTGKYDPRKGLKQGYQDRVTKKYYGEYFFEYLRLAQTVNGPAALVATLSEPIAGRAIVALPTPVEAAGQSFVVDVREGVLRVRSSPTIDADKPTGNVVGQLPDGTVVKAVSGARQNGFIEIETSLNGALVHGFVAAKLLKAADGAAVEVVSPAAREPTTGLVAVYMPRRDGVITRRREPANGLSLNEPNQPGRNGTTPDALRADLAAIIKWLAVDNPAFVRYQPHSGLTFCNIYAHDYCYLAGVYLPRVWWSAAAIEKLSRGEAVEPLYGRTIDEQRANDLFRWLRDFGPRFGWRQTGTLTKLQTEANQGAIGIIVARRKEDGRSGHIVIVAPETEDHRARRDANGEVVAPNQSQAGSTNFRYGTGRLQWWKGEQFAESAFWLHA